MKVLPRPPAAADEKVLQTLCKHPNWAPHHPFWLAAYRQYHACGGDPAHVAPTVFAANIADAQRNLYDLRKRNGPLRRLRRTESPYCPMCGSGGTGGLDHALPRAVYPEFSILRANLVPACQHCNSAEKVALVPAGAGERFLHPYFDDFLDDPIWWVRIRLTHGAATFHPQPWVTLDPKKRRMVRYHLSHVLGWQFSMSMAGNWANLLVRLRDRLGVGVAATIPLILPHLADMLRDSEAMDGVNAWRAAFYRGVALDRQVLAFLAANI
jgi:hypothetical protein